MSSPPRFFALGRERNSRTRRGVRARPRGGRRVLLRGAGKRRGRGRVREGGRREGGRRERKKRWAAASGGKRSASRALPTYTRPARRARPPRRRPGPARPGPAVRGPVRSNGAPALPRPSKRERGPFGAAQHFRAPATLEAGNARRPLAPSRAPPPRRTCPHPHCARALGAGECRQRARRGGGVGGVVEGPSAVRGGGHASALVSSSSDTHTHSTLSHARARARWESPRGGGGECGACVRVCLRVGGSKRAAGRAPCGKKPGVS